MLEWEWDKIISIFVIVVLISVMSGILFYQALGIFLINDKERK